MTTYEITRDVMTSAELATHKHKTHGRYAGSSDGYDDMELGRTAGWRAISGWGRDGWDLGDWPLVVISVRDHDGRFFMQQVVEGDHDVYTFDSEADRDAAIDYLFLWYAAGKDLGGDFPVNSEDRERLDKGEIEIDGRLRGPFSWARLDAEKPEIRS